MAAAVTARPTGTVPEAVAAVFAAQAETAWAARSATAPPTHGEWLAIGLAAVAELRAAGWHITPLPELEIPTVRHTPCPSCQQPKSPGRYLCLACWQALPDPARRALSRRDQRAMARLRELHAQLAAGVPAHEIRVSA